MSFNVVLDGTESSVFGQATPTLPSSNLKEFCAVRQQRHGDLIFLWWCMHELHGQSTRTKKPSLEVKSTTLETFFSRGHELLTVTLTFELNLDSLCVNQHAKS